MSWKDYPISMAEVLRAGPLVHRYIKPSQLIRYEGLSQLIGADIYIKHENHNPAGSFKIRGGVNLMHHLQGKVSGVITFSTGNHGLSVATAAAWFGVPSVVVVPEHNNPAKNRAIIETGAELIEAGKTFEEASLAVEQLCQKRGLYYVHPADEPHLINGVGTEFVEICEALPDIDTMILPVGAGSEAAAAVTVFEALRPETEIIAVQAEQSPAACLSWREQTMLSADNKTFAGGFATGQAYAVPFQLYRDRLSDFVLLTEDEIYQGIALAMYYTHNLAEGAGSSTIMAAIKLRSQLQGKKVVLQMSGANASADELEVAMQLEAFRQGYRA